MENHCHPQQSTKVLSMNLNCCDQCPKILKKKLLKMPGVDSVTIDTTQNLVFVTGSVDAMALVNKVAKLGKQVQLLPSDDSHRVNDTKRKGHCPHKEDCGAQKMHENSSYYERNRQSHKKEAEPEHKCEPYDPIKISAAVCRDPFCTIHPTFYKISDTVPPQSYTSFGPGNPYRGPYPYLNPAGVTPGWYGERPPPNARFGYYPHPHPRMIPRPPFGFH